MLRDNIFSRYLDNSETILEEASRSLNDRLENAERIIEHIKYLSESGVLKDRGDIDFYLPEMKKLGPDFNYLVYAGADGHLHSTGRDLYPDSYDPVQENWYKAAINASGPVWVEPYLSYMRQHIVFSVSVPVLMDSEGECGVVAAVFRIDDIGAGFDYRKLGNDGFMMLLSSEGVVLANRDNYFIGSRVFGDELRGGNNDRKIRTFEYELLGDSYFVKTAVLPVNGMYMATAMSSDEIHRSFMLKFIPVLIIEIMILLVLSLGMYALTRLAILPVNRLSSLMSKAKKGDYTVQAGFSGYREIRDLSEQFNRMLEAIRTRDEILKNREIEIKNLAYYDSLTGLPNRAYLQKTLCKVFRNDDVSGCLLFIDLDGFKLINDTMGHSTGDLVLKEVSSRLMHNLRYKQFAARIGGDEFVIFLQEIDSMEVIRKVAGRILAILNQPILIKHTRYDIGASIGVVLYPMHGNNAEILLKKADMAMYKAKRSGKNNYQIFEENLEEEIMRRNRLEKGIRKAMKKNLFHLNYQPQYDLKTGEICGFEALLRNSNKDLSSFSTEEIVSAAEETGMILEIERNAFREAFEFINQLNAETGSRLTISVNVSSQHLMQSDFHERFTEIVAESGIEKSLIDLEITESVMMESMNAGKQCLEMLKATGIRISMDDFGTGYSSLSYLQNLPIDCVKIDRSFIEFMDKDHRKRDMISLIIRMAQSLDLRVVAEGIENETQYNYLKRTRCDFVQGFFLNRPMDREAIFSLFKKSLPV